MLLLLAGCSPSASHPRTPEPAGPSARAAAVLATAERYLGTRYRYGGTSPAEGFDCSGFVQFVFGRNQVALPRTSRQQAAVGRVVRGGLEALVPGDLLFFASGGRRIDHVAIYAGEGRIIHASRRGVRYDELGRGGGWFLRRHVASRRILAPGRRA